MKDTSLWLHLEVRRKSDGQDLYSSIGDFGEWNQRNSNLKTIERAQLYYQILVEVNELDLSVQKRLIFLEQLHTPVQILITELSKKYVDLGLPLIEEKSNYVEIVNSFWSEMAMGYKIILDDLSDASLLNAFFNKSRRENDLMCALYSVLYYLNGQLFSSYKLYSVCNEGVWRDLHQIYRYASKNSLTSKTVKSHLTKSHSICDIYKKILLFSLANPYHLSTKEMEAIWVHLDEWSLYVGLNFKTSQVFKKEYPFLIKPYSDQPPFSNYNNNRAEKISEFELPDFISDTVWGLETKKLLKQLNKKSKVPNISNYLCERLKCAWIGTNTRLKQRESVIEPVVIAIGVSFVSKFLSQIDIVPRILKLEEDKSHNIEPTSSPSAHLFYQAYLIDESKDGIRLKISQHTEKTIMPNMGDVVSVKHMDDSVQVGYLRWMKENSEGDVEFGLEHLSSMAESVQLSKASKQTNQNNKENILDSFVFPGGKEYQFKPILFTHTFVEKFYDSKTEQLILSHKTGSIKITLMQKVDEVLDYSLYLFEKSNTDKVSILKEKSAQFKKIWDNI